MINHSVHRILVTSGCLIWCASYLGEVFKGQPYSTLGIIVSPILIILGIYFWFKNYRATRGHNPRLETVWDNTTFIGGYFTLKVDFLLSHIFEFWTLCIIIWMGLALIFVITFRCSDAFEVTKQYCQNNQNILSQTGEIKYYGVFVSGGISSFGQNGKASLLYTIVGKKGNYSAHSNLVKQSGIWSVEKTILYE